MKTKILFLFVIVAIILFGCKKEINDASIYNLHEPNTLTTDDYEIYNLIANSNISVGEITFIDQKTHYVDIDTFRLKQFAAIEEIMIQNYYSRNDTSLYLNEDSFSIQNNVILIPENVNDRNVFKEKYTLHRSRALSNISYNVNYTQAIVGVMEMADYGCIFYYTYYLKKENNKWLIIWNSKYGHCNI
jgi:hypothetical protein